MEVSVFNSLIIVGKTLVLNLEVTVFRLLMMKLKMIGPTFSQRTRVITLCS